MIGNWKYSRWGKTRHGNLGERVILFFPFSCSISLAMFPYHNQRGWLTTTTVREMKTSVRPSVRRPDPIVVGTETRSEMKFEDAWKSIDTYTMEPWPIGNYSKIEVSITPSRSLTITYAFQTLPDLVCKQQFSLSCFSEPAFFPVGPSMNAYR